MKRFYIFWLNVFVFGGQSVVDKTTVEEGQMFTITCDHLHVNGTVPSCRLVTLEVNKRIVPDGISLLLSLPNEHPDAMNIPNHWMKDCENPNPGVNATQVYCKLIVKDAKISDSGQYGCVIGVSCNEGPVAHFDGVSHVVVTKVSGGQSAVDKTTVEEGQSFNITCDHLHVNGTVPSCRLVTLEVNKRIVPDGISLLLSLPNEHADAMNIPNHWTKDCENPNPGVNATQVYCKLIVKGAKISDSGQYGCVIGVSCNEGPVTNFAGVYNVVVRKVFGGQSAVDKTTVEEGQSFNITCDHLHVNGTVPSCRLVTLEVNKRIVPDGISLLLSLPNEHPEAMNIPNHWTKDCENPNPGVNATQVYCKLIVKRAKISDSGQYGCVIGVSCNEGPVTNFDGVSHVVVMKVSGGQNAVEKTTVEEGQMFTITCDHLHVNGTVPSCRLVTLEVNKRIVPDGISLLLSLPNEHPDAMNIPNHWTKDCENPNPGVNATQVCCKLIVKEAKMSDSGQYGCVIGVSCNDGPVTNFDGISHVVVMQATSKPATETKASGPSDTRKTETITFVPTAGPNDNTTKSESPSSFGEKTIIGLCLLMIAATQL